MDVRDSRSETHGTGVKRRSVLLKATKWEFGRQRGQSKGMVDQDVNPPEINNACKSSPDKRRDPGELLMPKPVAEIRPEISSLDCRVSDPHTQSAWKSSDNVGLGATHVLRLALGTS